MTASCPLLMLLVFAVVALGHQVNLVPDRHRSSSSSSTSYSSSSTSRSQKDKDRLVKGLEANLLSVLGLQTRPRPGRDVQIPGYMLELYQQHLQGRGKLLPHRPQSRPHLTLPANTVRSFYQEDRRPGRARRRRSREEGDAGEEVHKASFYFNVSTMPDEEVLSAAELRVYHRDTAPSPGQAGLRHRVEVHEVMRPAGRDREAITRLLDTRLVHPRRARWESFDVHPAVLRWRATPGRNHGLEVHVLTAGRAARPNPQGLKHVRLRRSLRAADPQWAAEQPFLVTYSDDGRGPRKPKRRKRSSKRHKKRSRSPRTRKQRKDECFRHNLYVDFSEVGWEDWIVAPPGYQAYYCHGECNFPYPDYTNTTNHAIVQTLVHAVNPKVVPKPCCVPTELSPISMLYLDEYEKVVLKNYQDMVVQRCGCL